MSKLTIPKNYSSALNLHDTQLAIKTVKDFFQGMLAQRLSLTRVSAPLFVDPTTGLNDNLNGYERPVTFGILEQGDKEAEVVHSLAKWKRYALKKYGFSLGEGIYTDMNAIRRDEETDNIHSIFVDQWDWEKIIRKEDGRVLKTLGELATESLYSLEHSQHITAETTAQIKSNAYSFGCSFAEVEVDVPLCKVKLLNLVNVHDCGPLINPALAEAQVHGGMSMAIGYGLSEQLLFDEKTGKPLNNNLLDYKLSTIMDHPHLEAQFVENAEPTSAFGTKALGEPPACSPAPAIRNAILNATGVAIDTVPITPHVLYAEFSKAGLIHDSWKEEK